MGAGIDSRSAMELRQALSTTLGMSLPVTLLYDYQSVAAISGYITSALQQQLQVAGTAAGPEGAGATAAPAAAGAEIVDAGLSANKPSPLLKTLRAMPAPRPLFLAAPGVANAQSAYFAFANFLAWSDQPIYVLDKDNDMDIYTLARANAEDILKVQPQVGAGQWLALCFACSNTVNCTVWPCYDNLPLRCCAVLAMLRPILKCLRSL